MKQLAIVPDILLYELLTKVVRIQFCLYLFLLLFFISVYISVVFFLDFNFKTIVDDFFSRKSTIVYQWFCLLNEMCFIHIFLATSYTIGRTAFLGLGFGDRSDSFDLNVALQDHFKWVKNQEKIEQDKIQPPPELDLGFKPNETIRINMKFTVRTQLV